MTKIELVKLHEALESDLVEAAVAFDWTTHHKYAQPVCQEIVDFVMSLETDILDRLQTLQKVSAQ